MVPPGFPLLERVGDSFDCSGKAVMKWMCLILPSCRGWQSIGSPCGVGIDLPAGSWSIQDFGLGWTRLIPAHFWFPPHCRSSCP